MDEIFALIGNTYSFAVGTLIPFLIVLTVIVFIHELGHFLVGRWCGVNVDAFSIGFGPEIWGWNDRSGTRWKFCVIPLGGYVKFQGDSNVASFPDGIAGAGNKANSGSYLDASVLRRLAISLAGPFANFLGAILIFAAVYMIVGEPRPRAFIGTVIAGGAAETAGLKTGDRVISIAGQPISQFRELAEIVQESAGLVLSFEIEREGIIRLLKVVPNTVERLDGTGATRKVGLIGVRVDEMEHQGSYQSLSLPEAVWRGTTSTARILEGTVKFLGNLVVGDADSSGVGGPIRIAQIASDAASQSIASVASLAAILSVSIGFINLLPIPMLDGGHVVFYLIELIRKKPLSPRIQEISFRIGLLTVVGLMIVTTLNDVIRIFYSDG